MEKRFFNTTGYCNPDKHYTINPLRGVENEIYQLIKHELYFVIHAPRQSGKTTLLHSFTRKLNTEGEYIAVVCSFEQAGYRSISEEQANIKIIESIKIAAEQFLVEEYLPTPEVALKTTLLSYLSEWSKILPKPLVLFVDEIDALYDDTLVSVLRQLRNGFQFRPTGFPASIALVGLRDVRDYKDKVRGEERSIGSGSPFNIKAESFRLANFTRDEVAALYAQHTADTGQVFPDNVIDLVHDYTAGQPWLTNAIAREMTEKILMQDYSAPITTETARLAKENLILRRDTHLDSLMDKLMETRVRPIVSAIISGDSPKVDNYNSDLQYCIDLGIVVDTPEGIQIANKIYAEIIPRILCKQSQDELRVLVSPAPFIRDNKLNINALLQEFQKFYRRHSDSWMDKFSYREAGRQLLLMAFLQRITNGGGRIEREMAMGSGRSDLVVHYNNDCFVLELKINYNSYTREDGLDQLSGYLDKLGESRGYLILFEPKSAAEVPWENRLKWTEVEHEYVGVKRNITIVEM